MAAVPPPWPTEEWLDTGLEPVVEPDLAIVDPHHHLWPADGVLPYGLAELHRDLDRGHRVEQTVFVECHAAYRSDGPEHLAPVGETEFVTALATGDARQVIAGIVAHAELASPQVEEILDAHHAAGEGLVRGVRDALAWSPTPDELTIPGPGRPGKHAEPAFRAGLRRLAARGWSYDTWLYHEQLPELTDLARAVPEVTIVLDHFGTPLGVGRFAGKREEIFARWREDLAELARCENVVAKLGGLAMPDNGFGWAGAARPPSSDEFVAAQGRYYLHAIEQFGPQRCMFESNFPIDRFSLSYRTFWNAAKKLTAGFSADERAAMFAGTARRVYRLPEPA